MCVLFKYTHTKAHTETAFHFFGVFLKIDGCSLIILGGTINTHTDARARRPHVLYANDERDTRHCFRLSRMYTEKEGRHRHTQETCFPVGLQRPGVVCPSFFHMVPLPFTHTQNRGVSSLSHSSCPCMLLLLPLTLKNVCLVCSFHFGLLALTFSVSSHLIPVPLVPSSLMYS